MISTPVFCPRLVGRQRELAFLVECRRELARAHGGIVLVAGDAGIGKSRLVSEFLDATGRSRGRVAVGRCRPFASAPYEPLTELLETLAPSAARLSPAHTHAAQLQSIAGAFVEAAAKHATVAIIEDLHWSDSGTLDVLALLAERLGTSRMLVVATYRANEIGPEHPHFVALGALQRSRSVALVELAPLDTREARDFIDATLGPSGGHVPRDVRRRVALIAEGNPFFTEELLKGVVDGGGLQPERSLPTTIHAAIIERVRLLSERDRAVLTQAAVIGRRFDALLLAETLDTDVAIVLDSLQRAQRLQIVTELAEPLAFRFRHALTREAIYDQLLIAQRRSLHRHIAQVLEARAGSDALPDALGYHWWAAGDRAKALDYGERSGDAALALHSYSDALECYERTLSLVDRSGADAARIRAKMGTSFFRAGYLEGAIDNFRIAWSYFGGQTDDAPFVFRLARNLAVALYNDGRGGPATDFLGDAVQSIARCGDRSITAHARVTHASYLADIGAGPQAAEVLMTIDADLIAADTGLALTFWLTTCSVCALRGDVDGLRGAAENICAVANPPADASVFLDALAEAGLASLLVGETALAHTCFRRAIDTCVTIGSTATLLGDMLVTSALERVLSGAFDDARRLARRALPMVGEVKISRLTALLATLSAGEALDDHELLAFEPDAAIINDAFATGKPHLFGPLAALCALRLRERGEHAAARKLLRRALAAALAALPLFGSFPLIVVAAALVEPADAAATRALGERTREFGPAPRHAEQLCAALLSLRFGDPNTAAEPARAAAAGFGAIGWPLYAALAHEAAGDAATAQALRERIGYRGRFVLRPATAKAKHAAILTPREREVARLVAAGKTNRAVATALNVSVKLVEKHLSTIYAKLALTSRSQLTARIIALDGDDPG